jgi:hypothetical protein
MHESVDLLLRIVVIRGLERCNAVREPWSDQFDNLTARIFFSKSTSRAAIRPLKNVAIHPRPIVRLETGHPLGPCPDVAEWRLGNDGGLGLNEKADGRDQETNEQDVSTYGFQPH